MDTRSLALQWFDKHRDQYIADLMDWITVPSVAHTDQAREGEPYGPDVAAMFRKVQSFATAHGLSTSNHEGYAISVYEGAVEPRPQDRDFALVGHLDVVEPGPGWVSDPFTPYYRDGFVVGRGSDDNKGTSLLDLYLLLFLKENGVRLQHPLRVLMGGSEEAGLDDMRYYVAHYGAPYQAIVTDSIFPLNYAQKGDLIIRLHLPKPSSIITTEAGVAANAVPGLASITLEHVNAEQCRVLAQQPGITIDSDPSERDCRDEHSDDHNDMSNRVTITANGISGHSAFPEGTVNAVRVLADAIVLSLDIDGNTRAILQSLSAWSQPYGEGFGVQYHDDISADTTTNVAKLAIDGDDLVVLCDIRYAVTQNTDVLLNSIRSAVASVDGRVEVVEDSKPYYVDEQDYRVQTLLGAYNEILGLHSRPQAMGGGTHARVIPGSINFGPGFPGDDPELVASGKLPPKPDFVSGGAHGPNEWLNIDRHRLAFSIYALGLTRLDEQMSQRGE